MEFVPLVALGTLVFTVMNFLKFLSVRDWTSATTQGIAWLAGIIGVFVMAETQFASDVVVGGTSLGGMDFWTKVLVGLLATSLLSTANEFKKAIDNNDSAKMPQWFGRTTEAAVQNPSFEYAKGHRGTTGKRTPPKRIPPKSAASRPRKRAATKP